jgi:pSer/pThr/pTyr-binding forkhead associated (FHA) protein
MRAVVEVKSGSQSGHRFVLRAGQRLRFGRTNEAEAAFPDDEQMSTVHFRISADEKACYLQDLESRNGTLVNEDTVKSVVLRDGDEIVSGRTRFRLRIEGDSPEGVEPLPVVKAKKAGSSVAKQTIERVVAPFMAQQCISGLTVCRGHLEQIPMLALTQMLAVASPLYFVINFPILGKVTADEVERPDYIIDWYEPAVMAEASPVLIAAEQVEDWQPYFDDAWGNDALICLFSKKEQPQLLSHLRSLARSRVHADDRSQGALGFAWPSVLSHLLMSSQGDLTQRITDGIDMVLIEDQDHEELWQLFGDEGLPEFLSQFGMIESPEEVVLNLAAAD